MFITHFTRIPKWRIKNRVFRCSLSFIIILDKIDWDRGHPYDVVTTKMIKKQPKIDEKWMKIEMAGKKQK